MTEERFVPTRAAVINVRFILDGYSRYVVGRRGATLMNINRVGRDLEGKVVQGQRFCKVAVSLDGGLSIRSHPFGLASR